MDIKPRLIFVTKLYREKYLGIPKDFLESRFFKPQSHDYNLSFLNKPSLDLLDPKILTEEDRINYLKRKNELQKTQRLKSIGREILFLVFLLGYSFVYNKNVPYFLKDEFSRIRNFILSGFIPYLNYSIDPIGSFVVITLLNLNIIAVSTCVILKLSSLISHSTILCKQENIPLLRLVSIRILYAIPFCFY